MLRFYSIVSSRARFLIAGALIPLTMATQTSAQETAKEELSGAKFKNVTALADMPANQMGKVMNIMTASLGVNCQFCHDGTDFAKEAVGHKDIGREMIEMTLELNKRHFDGREEVTCFTCHRGQKHPAATVMSDPQSVTAGVKQPATKPTVEEILAKHVAAIGGKEKLSQLTTRHIVGKRIEPDGRTEPEEVWNTADGKYRMQTTYGSDQNLVEVAEVFDGKTAIKKANASPIQLKQDEQLLIERESQIGFGTNLAAAFSKLTFDRMATIDGSSVAMLSSKSEANIREQLYFSEQSGLLVRRTTAIPTVLGNFVYQVDYQDYKTFDGINLPTKLRFSVPNITWTREVISVEHNRPIDAKLFQ